MKNQQTAFFLEIQEIPRNEVPSEDLVRTENSKIFDELKNQHFLSTKIH